MNSEHAMIEALEETADGLLFQADIEWLAPKLICALNKMNFIVVPRGNSGITVDDPDWYTITDDGKAALEEYQRAHGVREAGNG